MRRLVVAENIGVIAAAGLAWAATAASAAPSEPTTAAACRDCHAAQYEAWERSDHFQAMRVADEDTVLGDFADARVSFHGIETRFFRDGGRHFVETVGATGKRGVFPVRYTFGWRPLQQYLLDAGDGRLQAFDVAWDTRAANQGGQRWFHLQPDESVAPGHPFFWTGHAMNWASQCASCHSTNVDVDVRTTTDVAEAAVTYSAVNVACEACHGPAAAHVRLARAGEIDTAPHAGFRDGSRPRIVWRLVPGERIASPDRAADARQIDMCGGCHALRTPLTDSPAGKPFHEAYRIQLMDDVHYFPDGQIREEVFVLGSFLQSRMHARGVTCGDCHDPHSGALVADGNAVCSQCHRASAYDVAAHHGHAPGTPGSACVDCHMPARTYMGVDARRDHAFPIPRPGLSSELGVPNACTGCHASRSNNWAQETLREWGVDEGEHWAALFHRLRRGDPGAAPGLAALVAGDTPPMVKASLPPSSMRPALQRGLTSSDPLTRRGAVTGAQGQPPLVRWRLLEPRLDDDVLGVRFEAAAALLEVFGALPTGARTALREPLAEHRRSLAATDYRAATQYALGRLEDRLGRPAQAQAAFRRALVVDPTSVPALVDYADLLQRRGDQARSGTLLERAVALAPDNPVANAALGLHLVRAGQRREALAPLAKAGRAPDASPRLVYIHAVAQHSLGDEAAALDTLRRGLERWPWDPDLLATLVIYLDAPESPEVRRHLATLAEFWHELPEVRALLDRIAR